MKFYTYIWMLEDGTPYYVGKGSDNRAWRKSDKRLPVPKDESLILVQEYESESETREAERFLINFYGRECNSSGTLKNKSRGGSGVSNVFGEEQSETLSFRTSPEMYSRLQRIAKGQGRSVSNMIRVLLTDLYKEKGGYGRSDCDPG